MLDRLGLTRNVYRNMQLRNNDDPKDVMNQLSNILQEAIHMQSSGSKPFANAALKELRQIRTDVIAGNINAGAQQNKMMGVYTHVINQLENSVADMDNNNNLITSAVGTIKKSFPSTDTLIAALMTANPLVGYGTKLITDLYRSRKEKAEKDKAEAKKRLSALRDQERYVQEQLNGFNQQEEAAKQQTEAAKDQKDVANAAKRDYKRGGIYRDILVEIRDEIQRLENYLKSSEDMAKVSVANSEQNVVALNDTVQKVVNGDTIGGSSNIVSESPNNVNNTNNSTTTVGGNVVSMADFRRSVDAAVKSADNMVNEKTLREVIQDAAEDIIKAEHDIAKQQKRDAKIERLKEQRQSVYTTPTPVKSNTTAEKKGGIFGHIADVFGLFRGLGGIFAGIGGAGLIASVVGAVKSGLGFFLNLGKMLKPVLGVLSRAGIVGAVVTAITAIYKFFDGFFNADEIIGKADNQITLNERIAAAVSNMYATVVGMVDSVAEFFGFDLIDTTDLPKRFYEGIMTFQNGLLSVVDNVTGFMVNSYQTAVNSVSNAIETSVNFVTNTFDRISNTITETIQKVKSFISTAIDAVKNNIQNSIDAVKNFSISDFIFGNNNETESIVNDISKEEVTNLQNRISDMRMGNDNPYNPPITPGFTQRANAMWDVARMEREAALDRANKEKAETNVAVNAPTANVTSVSNTIMQDRNTSNINPRLRMVYE